VVAPCILTGATDVAALSAMIIEIFTPLTALFFMVFCFVHPCVATLATIKKEMNGWWHAILVVFPDHRGWIVAL
jgi:ferrous iron transport protein B